MGVQEALEATFLVMLCIIKEVPQEVNSERTVKHSVSRFRPGDGAGRAVDFGGGFTMCGMARAPSLRRPVTVTPTPA